MSPRLPLAAVLLAPLLAFAAPNLERRPDGVVVATDTGWLLLQVRDENIIRVAAAPDRAFFARESFIVQQPGPPPAWQLDTSATSATLKTARLQVRVALPSGAVTFFDAAGQAILAERPGGRAIAAAEVQGEKTFHVRQQWEPVAGESLHGLGQHQLGVVDLKGLDLDLWQRNTVVVLPFLVSSRGYGLLWDNASFTRFGDLRPFAPIPAEFLRDDEDHTGGLTRAVGTERSASSDLTCQFPDDAKPPLPTVQWSGSLVPPATGDYQFQTYSNGTIKVWIDGRLVIDHWRQKWLTEFDQIKLPLEAGRRYALRIEFGGEDASTFRLAWKTPTPAADATTSLWSEVGDGVDYSFVYGPALDDVVAGYRHLTGRATLLPRWAFGLWQSRQRYVTAQESIEVVDEYRRRGIPLDNIVQDWSYWPLAEWGSHKFDAPRFPDPDGWIKALHERHARVMISVWGKFYPGTAHFEAMQKGGFLYQPTLQRDLKDWLGFNYTFYDAFSADARSLFWSQLDSALFRRGIDAWWMDATEPDVVQPSPPTLETLQQLMGRTALGSAARVLNAYPLFNSRAVYEGQRASAPDQRVFILTRSGFAGIQRYATVTWSGDTTATWSGLAKQIAAGLGYSLAGSPWWTMDIGGYTMQARFSAKTPAPAALDEWRELNTRWFQFGTFAPLTRLHGELQPREPWAFGDESSPAYRTIVKFDRLRYRLLPYLYSVAGAVNRRDSTLLRPLVMDFPTDVAARSLTDEYLFGPALLVAPVTTYQARSRSVHLPATPGGWFDFWTGRNLPGGAAYNAAAPYDALPLFVRAGSILPLGPVLQYTDEKTADPIALYVYAGADGAFTFYEDDGLTYGYERGEFAEIPIRWDDATHTLSFAPRTGAFPGMLPVRTFNVYLVSPKAPLATGAESTVTRTVRYRGDALDVHLE